MSSLRKSASCLLALIVICYIPGTDAIWVLKQNIFWACVNTS